MKNLVLLFTVLLYNFGFSQTFSGTGGVISDDGLNNDFNINVSGLSPAIITGTHGLVGVCLNISHTYDSDLSVNLIAPDGTEITLFSYVGGGDDDFTNTCFSQSSSTSIISGIAPFTGFYKPMNTLGNANNGQIGNGNWILRIVDGYAADIGTLINWNLTFGPSAPTPITFSSSNLPIVVINTFSQTIVNEPKINASMKIIDNGPGLINHITDPPNAYNNKIGIEIRGSFSSSLPQKPYAFETRNASNLQHDTVILGMPAEHDWSLLATYNDKVYVRNTLANKLFLEMGHYATKPKHCEVVINGQYQGVYLLSEKIKRDSSRVNISKLDTSDNAGMQLTGGYIIKNDYWDSGNSWLLSYNPIDHPSFPVHLVYEYPKPEDITPQQKTYIQAYINSLETALYSPTFTNTTSGYRAYLSARSFIDYFIVNELSRNNDGFKKSWFMHKNRDDKGGKLHAGPVWDFDWAWANIPGCSIFSSTTGSGWAYKINDCGPDVNSNGWYVRMLQDSAFTNELKCRWLELRTTILDTSYLFNYIDSTANVLDSAQFRHQQKWATLGLDVGTPEIDPQPLTYKGDVELFKNWIRKRIAWLDANMPGEGVCSHVGISVKTKFNSTIMLFPNPATHTIWFKTDGDAFKNVKNVIITDVLGKVVLSQQIAQVYASGMQINISNLQSGLYLCSFKGVQVDMCRPIKFTIQK